MKKIFALMLSLGAMTAVFAQNGHRNDSRDVILGQQNRSVYDNDRRVYDDRRNDGFTARERDAQIQRIYRDYSWRIESVQRDRYMRNGEKKRQIRFLENERDAKIRDIRERYNRSYRNNSRRY